MTGLSLLILEDEPLILMDLEFAAQDRGCRVHSATNCAEARAVLDTKSQPIDLAILDVSLGGEETCQPIAQRLHELGIPFILHSGDLDRRDELIRSLNAPLIAKPASSEKVIGSAIAFASGRDLGDLRIAAE